MMSSSAILRNLAEEFKQDGNLCFKKARLGAAINAYTKAIALCPNVADYWTNRAVCYRTKNDWTNVESDCRQALLIDQNSAKAHFMLGQALVEKKEFAEGIKELEKALDLGRGGADLQGCKVEELWREIAKAKYLEWEDKSSKRLWELQTVKNNCEMALKEQQVTDPPQKDGFMDSISISDARELEILEQAFEKAAEEDVPTEVPHYLCCKISLDILYDPVITPSGITYERALILDHLEKVGQFDPVTREPLLPSQLAPNLAIKEAVTAYLEKHGWAYRMD